MSQCIIKVNFFIGSVVQELHHTVNDWISQVVRVYPKEEQIEFDWLIGPIPVKYYQLLL